MAAQIVHAAGESVSYNLPPNTNAVVLSVPDESALMEIGRRLVAAGVAHVCVREPDAPYFGQATAIGVKPVRDRKLVRGIVSKLPLYGKCDGAKAPSQASSAHPVAALSPVIKGSS